MACLSVETPELLDAAADAPASRSGRRPTDDEGRRHAQQDRADQAGEGRPRHRSGHPGARAGRLGGDRRRRPRAAEVGRRVLPAADTRPVHDAAADSERLQQRRAGARDRRRRRGVRHAARRHHDPAADSDSRFRHRARAGDLAPARARRPAVAADRHGQHPQRHRLCGRRPDAGRAVRRLAGRPRVHRACSSATRRSRTCRGSSTSASAAAPSTARTPSRRTWR